MGDITPSRGHAFLRQGKCQVWPWEITICQWSCLLWSGDTLSAYGHSASDRQMDVSSRLTNIVDQSDPNHDCYKGCEIIYVCFMLKPTLEMTFF